MTPARGTPVEAGSSRSAGVPSPASQALRPDLRGLTPYGAPQLDVPVRLNTNENPYPPPAEFGDDLAVVLRDLTADLNRYPDRDLVDLRTDLAAYLGQGLSREHIWAANGSNEIMQQLLQAFGGPGRRCLGFEPSYSMHRLIARATATEWIDEGREPDFTLDQARAVRAVRRLEPSVVFLTSPNNPTGTSIPLDVVDAVCAAASGIVVVDEAYAEFARDGYPSALTLLGRHQRLVVTRTMSKAFALAGARVGYLAAHQSIIDALQLVRLPYHLSALTQATARLALRHTGALLRTVGAVRAERDRLVSALTSRGLVVVPSDANFVLFGRFADQQVVWQALLDRGVLVRDVGLAGWLRVTAGRPEEGTAFLAALSDVV